MLAALNPILGFLLQAGDFTRPDIDWHALAPELTLLAVGALVTLIDVVFLEKGRAITPTIAGIGLLAETARYLVERAGCSIHDISVSTDHIRYLDRAGSVIVDDHHHYLFSSWNAIYRQLWRHARTRNTGTP